MTVATLYPNADGDLAELRNAPNTPSHWQDVLTNDGDTTYLMNDLFVYATYEYDLHHLDALPAGVGAISNVTVYQITRREQSGTNPKARIIIKTNGVIYYIAPYTPDTTYTSHNNSWATNPQTGVAWTIDEVNGLQIGEGLLKDNTTPANASRCTQVYVEVTYTTGTGGSGSAMIFYF